MVLIVNKNTAGKLLAILNDHGDCDLGRGADDRVPVYLAAVKLLPELQEQVKDSADNVVAVLADGEDPEDALRDFSRHAQDMEKLAYLLSEVRSC